ncbi:hypothetical protein [Streptacidiphilus sp. EB103A]|uniref:hypothetical protein n=1 Tax=Streptacidiphilus sp. EB103A TaxID=3156275 RepID=UPI0035133895
MSKSQKGRRHRTVNRRPRPVGSAAGPVPVPVPVTKVVKAEAAEAAVASVEEGVGPLFQTALRDGGLGLPAARTWRHLLESDRSGATVEEISATVGYQPQTIGRHVSGLLKYGMVRESEGRWYPTGKSQWNAAEEHGLLAAAPAGAPVAAPAGAR